MGAAWRACLGQLDQPQVGRESDLLLRRVSGDGRGGIDAGDFNPDEAIWDWAREEVTVNTCLGTAAKVREKIDGFFAGLAKRTAEVRQRGRTTVQAQADDLMATANQLFGQTNHVDLTLVSV